ncbi:MAG: MATE family efflux transporter [Clostridiales bacterium]|nr:MATE family efflux transporter [Clostridiales bacterium]
MEHNALAAKFSFLSLLKFALPNIIMMIFLSLYTIVDGMFVSRFVGTLALSAINMSYPVNCLEMALGIMLATGGSAVIARQLGEGREQKAKESFTFLVLVSLLLGILCMIIGIVFIDEILYLLGTSEAQYEMCREYTLILVGFAPAFFLQTAFQTLFVTAGKPNLGLFVTVCGGMANIVLDYVFIVILNFGIAGAALATVVGYMIPAVTGILYFTFQRKGTLYFVKCRKDLPMLRRVCFNGSSEMVTNIANAVTTFLFNMLFLRFYGEDGVAAITIVLYFQFVFAAVFFGFSMGVAPVISFKYGADEREQLRKIIRYCMCFVLVCSAGTWLLSMVTIETALGIFTETGNRVFQITMDGFGIYALSFLLMGISIFASAMFTAFSDGMSSAIISFMRTFVFLTGMLLLLPAVMGGVGIWAAVPVAELLGVLVAIWYLVRKRGMYHY